MKRFIGLLRTICGGQVALLAFGSAPALAAGPVPMPHPAALAASPGTAMSGRANATGTAADGGARRLPGVLYVKRDPSTVWYNSLLARPLAIAHETRRAPKVAFSTRPVETLGWRPGLSHDRRGFTLNVLDRRVQISRVAVAGHRLEVVFTTRF